MKRIFDVIEGTMNQSALIDLRNFIKKYNTVTKWVLCSDYCIDDPNKPNNVISFTLFPYIYDFENWNRLVASLESHDLKKVKNINPEFCKFLKSGFCLNISFYLDKDNFFEKALTKETLDYLVDKYIEAMEHWIESGTSNKETYIKCLKKLNKLKENKKSRNFNYKLLRRMYLITFIAGYLRYLLFREVDYVDIYSWLSDRDSITTWQDEVYLVFYRITSHLLVAERLQQEKVTSGTDLFLEKIDSNMIHDDMNRIADYICGALADYDYVNNRVTSDKHNTLIEEAISDNPYIIVLKVHTGGTSRMVFNHI